MPENRRFCPHCSEVVSASTFRRHRMLYYSEITNEWQSDKPDHNTSSSGSDMEVEDYCSDHVVERGLFVSSLIRSRCHVIREGQKST